MGFYTGENPTPVSWADVKDVNFDYMGLKIVERNGQKHRIYLSEEDRDNAYKMDLMLKNLRYLHSKTTLKPDGLITNLLRKMEFGLTFANEMAQKYRQDHIKLYAGGLLGSVVILMLVIGILWIGGSMQAIINVAILFLEHGFNTLDMDGIGHSELKGLGIIAASIVIILAQLYLIVRHMFLDKTSQNAEIIKADTTGLHITYPSGKDQHVSWQKMDELWQDPNYGMDGNFYFTIHHSNDGARLLIDFLPYAVDYYVHGDQTFAPK